LGQAKECLQDVVSHAGDFSEAIEARLVVAREDDREMRAIDAIPVQHQGENESYWDKQRDVLKRMVKQATVALAAAKELA
jgi:hypothetical protein